MNLINQEIKKLDFRNDFLLDEDKIFIDSSLNIYGVLIKKEDMQNNKKGIILKKCPYVYDDKDEIKQLIQKLKDYNFITLRQVLSDYLNIKRIIFVTHSYFFNKFRYIFSVII